MKKDGRKNRKQNRKQKQAPWITKEEDLKLRLIANRLTDVAQQRMNREHIHVRCFCNQCQMFFCKNASGKDSYCKECFVDMPPEKPNTRKDLKFFGCGKEVKLVRLCQYCENHQKGGLNVLP